MKTRNEEPTSFSLVHSSFLFYYKGLIHVEDLQGKKKPKFIENKKQQNQRNLSNKKQQNQYKVKKGKLNKINLQQIQ